MEHNWRGQSHDNAQAAFINVLLTSAKREKGCEYMETDETILCGIYNYRIINNL